MLRQALQLGIAGKLLLSLEGPEQRAVIITAKLPPLPQGYDGSDLGVHLGFEYSGP